MIQSIVIAFVVGGIICIIGQLIMDLTPFSIGTAHVLVGVIIIGQLLSVVGIYEPFLAFAGMGAAVPLCGFGHTMMQGALNGMSTNGIIGLLGGGLAAGAVGISVSVLLGYLAALITKPRT